LFMHGVGPRQLIENRNNELDLGLFFGLTARFLAGKMRV
jgi:hypothetical protein